ncbi:MAG: DUF262 domain-containing HNH endonuclease family protein [Hyphomicrobiaceae bacterium]
MPVTRFQAEMLTIAELLDGQRQLVIPEFQRPYSWTQVQVDRLLSDLLSKVQEIEAHGDEVGPHYLGSMVMTLHQEGGRARGLPISVIRRRDPIVCEVIDGKQRLMTLTLLIAVIRDLLGPDPGVLDGLIVETSRSAAVPAGTPRLLPDATERSYFEARVQRHGATAKRMDTAVRCRGCQHIDQARTFLRRELKALPRERLALLGEVIAEHCLVCLTSSTDRAGGYDLFIAQNSKGLSLSPADVLKATLIGKASESTRPALVERWNEVGASLHGRRFDQLIAHVRTIESTGRTSLIEDIHEVAERAGGARAFIDGTLVPFGRILELIDDGPRAGDGRLPAGVARVLGSLALLKSRDWVPAAMVLLRGRASEDPEVGELLARLERIAFALPFIRDNSDTKRQRMRRVLARMADPQSRPAPGDADDPLSLTADEQREIFHVVARNPYRQARQACRSLLLRLSADLPGNRWPEDMGHVTLEHVLPLTHDPDGEWAADFPDAEQRERCAKSIGNMVLVTPEQNRRAGRRGWPRKKAIYFDAHCEAVFAINEDLRGIDVWNADAILAREARILDAIIRFFELDAAVIAAEGTRRSRVRAKPR